MPGKNYAIYFKMKQTELSRSAKNQIVRMTHHLGFLYEILSSFFLLILKKIQVTDKCSVLVLEINVLI